MKRDGLGEDARARSVWEGGLAARAGHDHAVPGARALPLTGELDLADRPQLRHAASRALAERPTEVLVVDMTRVSFFDSSVAHWLLEAHWQATAGGTRVVVLVADRDSREMLSMLGVAGVVSVVDG